MSKASNTEFLSKAVLPPNVTVDATLNLSAKQRADIEAFIAERAEKSIDYKYSAKDHSIARTAIADLKGAENRGAWIGLGTWALSFWYINKKTKLASNFMTRRFLHTGCFFLGAIAYYGVTQNEYEKYRGISAKLNTRISNEFSQMMNLKPREVEVKNDHIV